MLCLCPFVLQGIWWSTAPHSCSESWNKNTKCHWERTRAVLKGVSLAVVNLVLQVFANEHQE